jgi:hypothetical protein
VVVELGVKVDAEPQRGTLRGNWWGRRAALRVALRAVSRAAKHRGLAIALRRTGLLVQDSFSVVILKPRINPNPAALLRRDTHEALDELEMNTHHMRQ